MAKNIFYRLAKAKSYLEGETVEPFRTEALKIVNDFVMSGEFFDYIKKDLLIKTAQWSEDDAARELEVSGQAIRKMRSRFSAQVDSIIGADAIDIIMFKGKREVSNVVNTVRLQAKGYTSEGLFDPSLRRTIRNCVLDDKTSFDIGDCKVEMTVLHWLSTLKHEQLLSWVDIDKLGFLLDVLDGKRGTPQDRLSLLRVLTCDDPRKHCRREDIRLFTFPPVVREDEDAETDEQ